MDALPEPVSQAWDHRNGPIVLATVSEDGTPNVIYATCVSRYADDQLVVADNYFHKTRSNIEQGSKGSILFITRENVAFQIKGRLTRHLSGPVYDHMKQWNPAQHPGHAAVAMKIEEVYQGAHRIL